MCVVNNNSGGYVMLTLAAAVSPAPSPDTCVPPPPAPASRGPPPPARPSAAVPACFRHTHKISKDAIGLCFTKLKFTLCTTLKGLFHP